MSITQTITEYAGDLPNKDTMTPDEFDDAAEDWVEHQVDLAKELNEWAAQANAVGIESADLAVAQASANFLGRWEDLPAAAITQPCSVWHDENYWMLLEATLADPTASEPSLTNTDWAPIILSDISVVLDDTQSGDYIATAEELLRGVKFSTDPATTEEITVELPAPQTGYKASFYCGAAYKFACICDGYPFRWGARVTGVGTAYDTLYTSTVGTYWTVQAFDNEEWVLTEIIGAITADDVDA